MSLVNLKNLRIYFEEKRGLFGFLQKQRKIVHAVDGISFNINKGEILGLVGESGCGKSTTGMGILRLVEPTDGEVFFNGRNVFKMSKKEMYIFRRKTQIVFQDAVSSLNPRKTVREILSEPLRVHRIEKNEDKIEEKLLQTLELIGLKKEDLDKFPSEFSGGQIRRVGISRALILQPQFLVADEPTSGLDVSVAAGILNLMRDLRDQFNLTYLWVSHNLHVVRYISDRIAVMYLGKLVEIAETTKLISNPLHPYAKALFSAIPTVDPKERISRIILKGEIPSVLNPPSGCRFRTRCDYKSPRCAEEEPALIEVENAHFVSCHLYTR